MKIFDQAFPRRVVKPLLKYVSVVGIYKGDYQNTAVYSKLKTWQPYCTINLIWPIISLDIELTFGNGSWGAKLTFALMGVSDDCHMGRLFEVGAEYGECEPVSRGLLSRRVMHTAHITCAHGYTFSRAPAFHLAQPA